MSNALRDRLLKASTSEYTAMLDESKIYTEKDMVPTPVPMINTALSGSIRGGLTPGVTMMAGPSKHFKTGFALLIAAAYLHHHPGSILLFYDSEFGSPASYFKMFGIPADRVVHTPVTDIEELRHDMSVQLDGIKRGDRVVIVIDSIGNLASKKEVDDALSGHAAADMTRAKMIKSLFRIITPKLTLKDVPLIVINHTYKEIGMFPKDIVGGGTGSYYAGDNIWILGRRQDKDGTDLNGYKFVINIEKSRFLREKSVIPITISFDNGINKWSGLLELAIEAGLVQSPKKGWYAYVNPSTGELSKNMRAADIENSSEFWNRVFEETDFEQWIEKKYKLQAVNMLEEQSE